MAARNLLPLLLLVCALFPLTAAAYDGFVVLRSDEANTPFDNPVDLAGRSVVLTLQPDGAYGVASVASRFDADLGTPAAWEPGALLARHTLTRFAFPFFGRSVTELTLSRQGGIFTAAPPEAVPGSPQYDWIEAVVQQREPVIAPLLARTVAGAVTIHVKELDDRAVFTWTVDGPRALRMQAALFRNGDIVFSYDEVHPEITGVVMVSRGLPSLPRHLLAGDTDASDDATLAALDITSVSISRVADLDLLEVRLTTKTPLDPATLPTNHHATYEVDLGGAKLTYFAAAFGNSSVTPVRGGTYARSLAVTADGNSIVFLVDQDHLGVTAGPLPASVRTSLSNSPSDVDRLTFDVQLGTPARSGEIDLSAAAGQRHADLLVEAFTIPALNPYAAWEQLKTRYGLTDAGVDTVAFYTNFTTDLRTFASAYSTVGNCGADGVWTNDGSSSSRPKTPALLHMNDLDYQKAANPQRLLLHEFGHRWLFWVDFIADGARSGILNGGAHPQRYVHMPAASTTGASPMGGERWTDNGDGTFTRVPGAPGYSWLELYLMGLASASEVEPIFYIENAEPVERSSDRLKGTRRTVTIEQIIAALGPRRPAYPNAQKRFATLFVLVTRGTPTDVELATMRTTSRTFMDTFRNATAGRGEILLVQPPATPKRRTARH